MTSSPPYPNAPLQLVVVEVRHPQTAELSRGEVAALKQHLAKFAPLQATERFNDFHVEMGPSGIQGQGLARTREAAKFLTRNKRTAISFTSESLSVETTNYAGWSHFRKFLDAAIRGRQDIAPVDGLTRIGLRYIDEIRVPAGLSADWGAWVSRDLLAPTIHDGSGVLQLEQQQSVVQYRLSGPGETLALRYGAVVGPPAVGSTPNLVRPNLPDPGSYFLIDTDAAWTLVDGEEIPELEVASAMKRADHLHEPTRAVFESLITERLRKEVLA